jgi:putative transposase
MDYVDPGAILSGAGHRQLAIAVPRPSASSRGKGIWPWTGCARRSGVSRGGFYAWLTHASRRIRDNEELAAKVGASFLASDRTYGARRVWPDLSAEGLSP